MFKVEYYTTDILLIPEPGSALYEEAKSKSIEGFRKLLENLELHHDNPKHTFLTISNNSILSEAIKQIIAKNDIEFMVMGTQGTTRTKGVLFGSNTVKAMEKIRECPVLAVTQDFLFSPLKEIVFPTNFKSTFERKELQCLTDIAKMRDAALRILHISKKQELNKARESNKQLLGEIFKEVDHSFHRLSDQSISKGLISFVESRESDMIAFLSRKHFFFKTIFSNPLVKEIGFDAIRPILALH